MEGGLWMRIDGERRHACRAPALVAHSRDDVLEYGFANGSTFRAWTADGLTDLGPAPGLERPLRLDYAAERLRVPFARRVVPRVPLHPPLLRQRSGVREIYTRDPRVTRLWERFSVDVGVAVERDAAFLADRIFDRPECGYRVFVFEDGDRYTIRALCIFKVEGPAGYVMELLHDRSVDGMRAASHLLGLALREMSAAKADVARAWSLPRSGSFPIYALHAFFPSRDSARFAARALDPAIATLVESRHHWYVSYLDDETR